MHLRERLSLLRLIQLHTAPVGHVAARLVEALLYKPGSFPDGVIGIFH